VGAFALHTFVRCLHLIATLSQDDEGFGIAAI